MVSLGKKTVCTQVYLRISKICEIDYTDVYININIWMVYDGFHETKLAAMQCPLFRGKSLDTWPWMSQWDLALKVHHWKCNEATPKSHVWVRATRSQKIWAFTGKQVCGNPVYIMDLPQNDWHTKLDASIQRIIWWESLELSHNYICKMILPLTTIPTKFFHWETCSFGWNWIKMWNERKRNKQQFTLLVLKQKQLITHRTSSLRSTSNI